jgi:hypothetical protein
MDVAKNKIMKSRQRVLSIQLSDQEENALYCVYVAENFTISFVQVR